MPMYDSHMHTPLCKHAVGTPDEYAAVGHERGLTGIIFTCHNPLPDGLSSNVRMDPEQFPEYLEMVEHARQNWADKIHVGLGLECDYVPGIDLNDWLEKQAAAEPYDYLLVSVHPHLNEYRQRFWQDDPVAFQKLYFDHLVESAQLGLHDALAHPDLVKNLVRDDWDVPRILDHVRGCLDKIADTGIAMEINTSGWNKTVQEQNPNATILREIAIRKIPIVLGSDSHEPGRVSDRFTDALDLAQDAGVEHISYFIQRQRHDVLLADARATLAPTIPASSNQPDQLS